MSIASHENRSSDVGSLAGCERRAHMSLLFTMLLEARNQCPRSRLCRAGAAADASSDARRARSGESNVSCVISGPFHCFNGGQRRLDFVAVGL